MAHYFDQSPSVGSDVSTVDVALSDIAFTLLTDRGVFSRGHVDTGTGLLLREAPSPAPVGHLLDLGCGAGPLAMALALRSPGATVWAVDTNDRALHLTRQNCERNGVDNVEVCAPDDVPADVAFATIWSNPPIRIGKSALHDLLTGWLDRLAADGDAVLVVQKHLGADSLHRWLGEQGFATERVTGRSGFRLLQVSPRSRSSAPATTGSVAAMIDLARVRADTAGVDDVVHLNNCGSSLPPAAVVDAQVEYLRAEQTAGGYETQAARAADLDDFYDATAEMLGCRADEVSFQPNAAEAWWRAFTAVPLTAGDRVLAGASEYQANAFGLLQARDRGVDVVVVDNADDGTIDLEVLTAALDERVRLVCLTQISMSNGGVQPAAAVGRICRDAGVPFLVDACQVAGQRPIDVDAIGCDFLAYTGRKFMRGPRGTGVLYARRSTVDRLGPTQFVDGRSATWTGEFEWRHTAGAARFEWGERPYAAQVGLAVATRYALGVGLDHIAERVGGLAERLRMRLADVEGVCVHDLGADRSGIVTFTVDGVEPAAVQRALAERGINAGAPGRQGVQWDIGGRGLDAVVRAGVHYFNTDDELDRLLEVVETLAAA